MPDLETSMQIRREISAAEHDMRRATERAIDAVTNLRRAITIFDSPAQINLDQIEASIADLREARADYLAALKRRNELKAQLGE